MLERRTNGDSVIFEDYRFDLTGKLLSAARSEGKNDTTGTPARGPLKVDILDPKSREVAQRASAKLSFWVNGNYQDHLIKANRKGGGPKHDAGTKPASAPAR